MELIHAHNSVIENNTNSDRKRRSISGMASRQQGSRREYEVEVEKF